MALRLLSLLFIIYCLSACEQVGSSKPDSKVLIESIHIFEDIEARYNFSDIQKSQSIPIFIRQKHLDKVEINKDTLITWIMISPSRVINPSQNYLLELNRPTLDKVTAFISDGGSWKIIKTGDSVPFYNREIPHENFLFKIRGASLKKLNDPIYLKIQNNGISSSSVKLWEENEFHKMDQKRSLLIGLYFGAILALVIYNLFIYLSVKDVSYLWYVGYLGFMSLFLLAISGFTYRFFWPNSPTWANYSTYFTIMVSMATGLGFARSIFCIVSFSPALATAMKWLGFAITILALAGFFIGTAFYSTLVPFLGLGVIALIVLAIIVSIQAAYKPAYYATVGFLFIFAGSMMFILYRLEVLPAGSFTRHGLQIGVIIEAFLLALALAYRINYINEELKLSNQRVFDSKNFFSSRLIELQDEERKKTSMTLHDSIGQKLLVIKIQLAQIFELFNIQESHNKVKSVTGLVHEVINDVRDISHTLHPHHLEHLTLKEALEDLVYQSFKDSTIKYIFCFNDLESCTNKKSQLHVYRIIQESITNALKHSKAKNIEFSSDRIGKQLEIVIHDNGKGVIDQDWFKYDDFAKAHGLSSIKERANSLKGNVSFQSGEGEGEGFQIKILLPCENEGL